MELAQTTPAIGVMTILKSLPEGKEAPFLINREGYIRNQASLANGRFPDREYSVNRKGTKVVASWKRRELCKE
ncbi:hypothetical protein DBR40_21900 [Pedobacter sp. KBW01]|uniref:hypothetical protein n=1 Tax=Pedobacter sp. KBW01 TaxID=2153364 RepID=UPI000F598083|nr:hypothetical protein [Pedobacter sp. KBW01]RQO66807.1 hypothetical protein DBR40_21900 [Pedobacter sp. KBW01]